jgi:hypothetical protein
MDTAEILQAVVGPFGAVAIMLLVLVVSWRFIMTKAWPLFEGWGNRHMTQMELLVTRIGEGNDRHTADMGLINARLTSIENTHRPCPYEAEGRKTGAVLDHV